MRPRARCARRRSPPHLLPHRRRLRPQRPPLLLHRAALRRLPAGSRRCRRSGRHRGRARRAAPGRSQGTIQILSGPSAGKELPLSKPLTTLGKPGVQVAVIAKRPQGYFITHVEGATFPVVNGKQLDAQAHALNDHDVIELAGVKMEFYLKPAA